MLHANNPLLPGIGLTDPHITIFGDRAYLYATHDFSSDNSFFVMKDWWVWSSDDLVNWRQENILKPEQTFLGKPSNECWAGFCVGKNNRYYWYFSAGPREIGVVVSDTPTGPWHDPLGKPLLPEGLSATEQRDPDLFIDDDGEAYMVYGTFDYFVVRLSDDMISLAEKPRPIVLDRKFGPYGEGKTDDKPSLHKRNGLYYLSWSGYYAVSDQLYGPYTYKGCVITPEQTAPEFQCENLTHDRHGNFFSWHGQWYYTCNDKSQPGRSEYFRDSILCYVHYRKNGEIAPVRLDAIGVGQYDARQPRIEAEDYFQIHQAEQQENALGGFEVVGLKNGSGLFYPQVHHLPEQATISFHAASAHPSGANIEVRENNAQGQLLGRCNVPDTGGWSCYETVSCPLNCSAGTHNLYLHIQGGDGELLRLDWLKLTDLDHS